MFNTENTETRRTQRVLFGVFGLLCILSSVVGLARAQEADALQLSVRRLFGYGGGDQIQGSFRMELVEPPALESATFYIDEIEVGTVSEAPYRIDFDTDDYEHGWHDLQAVAVTPDNETLTSTVRRFEFVTAAEGWEAAGNIMIPLLSVVFGVIAVMFAIQILPSLRGKKQTLPLGATRRYGIKGGAICPKCHRPYSIHILCINLPFAYFDWCEHCGKWSLVRAASREQLTAAERAEVEMAKPDAPVAEETKEEKLARQVEESRYMDEN